MTDIRTILHPTDFSKNSKMAFRMACALRDYDARLVLLHVGAAPIFSYIGGFAPSDEEGIRDGLRRALELVMPEDPEIRVERVLRMSEDAAPTILDTAKEIKADMIVLGTHGWSGLSRLLMGSVAEKVVRGAPCPVLTVRVPMPARPEDGAAEEVPANEPVVVA